MTNGSDIAARIERVAAAETFPRDEVWSIFHEAGRAGRVGPGDLRDLERLVEILRQRFVSDGEAAYIADVISFRVDDASRLLAAAFDVQSTVPGLQIEWERALRTHDIVLKRSDESVIAAARSRALHIVVRAERTNDQGRVAFRCGPLSVDVAVERGERFADVVDRIGGALAAQLPVLPVLAGVHTTTFFLKPA